MEENKNIFSYKGSIEGYYPIFLKNLLFNILTLGIYSSWATTNNRRYFWANSYFIDNNFEYHGTGLELFIGRIKALGLILLWVIFFVIFIILFEGVSDLLIILGAIVYAVGIFAFIPLAIVGALKYRLSRTSWKEIRFNFAGDYREFTPRFLQGMLITILTLGIYGPFFLVSIWRYIFDNSQMGNQKFSFTGVGSQYFIIALKGFFFIPLTLGIYTFWYLANVYNFVINNVKIEGKSFHSNIKGGDVFVLVFPNFLILAFTIGLGWPIVIYRILGFFAEKIMLDSEFDPAKIEKGTIDMETATGEGLGVMLDLDL